MFNRAELVEGRLVQELLEQSIQEAGLDTLVVALEVRDKAGVLVIVALQAEVQPLALLAGTGQVHHTAFTRLVFRDSLEIQDGSCMTDNINSKVFCHVSIDEPDHCLFSAIRLQAF